MYFNSYFLTSIYFRVGIIELTKAQEDELKRLYKVPMLKKLGLSIKFLKELLYVRQSALSVKLVALNTALLIAALKLYIENICMNNRVSENIKISKEYNYILSGITHLSYFL